MTSSETDQTTITKSIKQITSAIQDAPDLNKLLQSTKFVKLLKDLPQSEQFQIFNQCKEQFTKLSENPQAEIKKLIENFKEQFPAVTNTQDLLNKSMQLGQEFLSNSQKDHE